MTENLLVTIRRKLKRYLRSYSRVILILKTWMFSLSALCLGFYFIYPQLTEQQKLFNISLSSDILNEAQSVQMKNIRFYHVDDKKIPYIVTAKSAKEQGSRSKIIVVDSPMADIVTPDGEAVNITSPRGQINQKKDTMLLEEKVDLFSSSGYQAELKNLHFDLKNSVINSDEPIFASDSNGNILAEGITVVDKGEKIYFKGNTTINIWGK